MTYPGFDNSGNEPSGQPVAPPTPAYPPTQQVPAQAPPSEPGTAPQPQYYAAYPAPGQQYPTAPTYDPSMMPQQFSAPPVSAPYGYGMPMSAMPMMAPPEKKGRVGFIVVTVLAVVFLLVAGVMSTLFLQQRDQTKQANAQSSSLSTQLTDKSAKLDQAQKDLDGTKRDLTDAKAATDEITTEKTAVTDCINAIYAYWDALDASKNQVTSNTEAKRKAASTKCAAADKYLRPGLQH